MTFEQSEVLFFSRGKGRGHAIPDVLVANELVKLGITPAFVSYGLGLETIKALGWDAIGVDLTEDSSYWEVACRVIPLIQSRSPLLVISHEEFAVLPISHGFGIPTIFLTDWIPRHDSGGMQCLLHADSMVFLDNRGLYEIPEPLMPRTSFVGPVVRELDCAAGARAVERERLEIDPDCALVLFIPGGARHHSESITPTGNLVLEAFSALDMPKKALIWIASDSEFNELRDKCREFKNITVRKPYLDILPTIAAADVVLTKGNRITTLECEAQGVPSISLSYGMNPIDDYRVSRIRSNISIRVRATDAELLHDLIRESLGRSLGQRASSLRGNRGPARTVAEIIQTIFMKDARREPTQSSNLIRSRSLGDRT